MKEKGGLRFPRNVRSCDAKKFHGLMKPTGEKEVAEHSKGRNNEQN
jgi:hypothetical protein